MTSEDLQSVAYRHLLDLIDERHFEPGAIYSERRIASEIGISRTPVRDAIQKLIQEGYLEVVPSRGFRLHEMDRRDIVETFQARSAIEGYCAVKLADEHDTADGQTAIEQLADLTRLQERILAETGDMGQFLEADNRFHEVLVAYPGNKRFNETFSSLLHRIKTLATGSLEHEGRGEETVREHHAILEAIGRGDSQLAYARTLAHMDRPQLLNLSDLQQPSSDSPDVPVAERRA